MRTFLKSLAVAFVAYTSPAFAEPEWVKIEENEETTQLVRDAPSVSFNDRTYRYEIAGTRDYDDEMQLEMSIWSDEFIPNLYVREAVTKSGEAGHGKIVQRSAYETMTHNGTLFHVRTLRFSPPETGKYRLVMTSYDSLNNDGVPITGELHLQWALFRWQEPEPPEKEPTLDKPEASVLLNNCEFAMPSLSRHGTGYIYALVGMDPNEGGPFQGTKVIGISRANSSGGVTMTDKERENKNKSMDFLKANYQTIREFEGSFGDVCTQLIEEIPCADPWMADLKRKCGME